MATRPRKNPSSDRRCPRARNVPGRDVRIRTSENVRENVYYSATKLQLSALRTRDKVLRNDTTTTNNTKSYQTTAVARGRGRRRNFLSVENIDKMIASGRHKSARRPLLREGGVAATSHGQPASNVALPPPPPQFSTFPWFSFSLAVRQLAPFSSTTLPTRFGDSSRPDNIPARYYPKTERLERAMASLRNASPALVVGVSKTIRILMQFTQTIHGNLLEDQSKKFK